MWQVAQLAVEHDSYSKIVGWLRQFINRHKEMITNAKIAQKREFPEHSEFQVNDDNKENEPEQIENPLVKRRKGRPETKRYKSSTEKPRVKYTCSKCGQSEHNSARCHNR